MNATRATACRDNMVVAHLKVMLIFVVFVTSMAGMSPLAILVEIFRGKPLYDKAIIVINYFEAEVILSTSPVLSLPSATDVEPTVVAKPIGVKRSRSRSEKPSLQSPDDVNLELLCYFDKLTVPLNKQKHLANIAVDVVLDNVSIATTHRKTLEKDDVIFCSIFEAIKKLLKEQNEESGHFRQSIASSHTRGMERPASHEESFSNCGCDNFDELVHVVYKNTVVSATLDHENYAAFNWLEELGRSVYVDEVFQQSHLRKDTGQFVDDRSRRTHEKFEARLSQARSDVASSVGESQLTPLDPVEEQRLRSRCWIAAAGPKHKGHIYGTGDLAHTYKCRNDSFMQHTQ
ncbi:hypothetical protein JHK85_050454 [Glycine max]|nr:hypothetical protein JHK85_050454 [Glycine max]